MELIKINNEYYTRATELHRELGIIKHFAQWVKANIKRTMIGQIDFLTQKLKSTGGRPTTEYFLKKDAAISFILISGGKKAKEVREKLIELYNKHESGKAFTTDQILGLIDICKAMTLVSIQRDVEKKHFILYNDKYTWHEYRAGLLGYSTETLIKAMQAVNKKHKSIRKSLVQLDGCELIRTGAIDLMIALGKTQEYAVNVGNLCKDMAEKMELGNQIWNDTIDNPLKINAGKIEKIKVEYQKQLV